MRIDAANFRVHSIEACELTLATCADQACRQRFSQSDTRMFEGASVNANPNRRHFLLLAPCNGFAVVVVTLQTQCFLTTPFRNYISMMGQYGVSDISRSRNNRKLHHLFFVDIVRCSIAVVNAKR